MPRASIEEIHAMYSDIGERIRSRLADFDDVWETADDDRLFAELAFCLFTPQSKAKSCWAAVETLSGKGFR